MKSTAKIWIIIFSLTTPTLAFALNNASNVDRVPDSISVSPGESQPSPQGDPYTDASASTPTSEIPQSLPGT